MGTRKILWEEGLGPFDLKWCPSFPEADWGVRVVLGTDPAMQVSKASFKGRLCSCGFFCTCSRKKSQPVPLLSQDGS